MAEDDGKARNGKLVIPLPLEDALRAALETPPPREGQQPKRQPAKKREQPKRSTSR